MRPLNMILGLLLVLATFAGFRWWSLRPQFPLVLPARHLVLQAADLPRGFVAQVNETAPIPDNPYEDHAQHYRDGYRAVFVEPAATDGDGRPDGRRVTSTSFVLDLQGARSVFAMYLERLYLRGQRLDFPPLGADSRFVIARGEAGAATVVVAVVRVENALITLTVQGEVNPQQVYDWAALLVRRATAGSR